MNKFIDDKIISKHGMIIFNYLTITMSVISVFTLAISLHSELIWDINISLIVSIQNIYRVGSEFKGLYQLTLAILATFIALNQYILTSQISRGVIEKEVKSNSLNLCDRFFSEFQPKYKTLVESGATSGIPVTWVLRTDLVNFNRAYLGDKAKPYFDKIDNIDRLKKNEIIILLANLESLSAQVLHGSIDKQFVKGIIGETYMSQVDALSTFIAYFRADSSSKYSLNTIILWQEWKEGPSEQDVADSIGEIVEI